MSSLLSIQLLGKFQLMVGQAPIAVPAARLRSLLAFLVLHGESPQAREQIAFRFWPVSSESQAKANLRKVLHQLRKTIPDATIYLAIEPGTVRWRRGAPYTSDVAQFTEALTLAQKAETSGDIAEQQKTLERAMELYVGDLLPSCYDDWIHLERERLRQAYGEALFDLIQLLESQGDYRRALHHAHELRLLDPLREAVYRQLMRLYSLSGDRAGAVEAFRQCEELLHEELGVEPGAATRDLLAQILAVDKQKGPPHNLPRLLTSFVGREAELATIVQRMGAEECRLLNLSGPGGIGKTRLALEAASRLVDAFEDGVFFVSLESVSSPSQLITTVAQALDFSFYRPDDLKQQLVDYLRRKQLLLVLDNFEHLLDAAGLLAELLGQAPGLKLLVTSRERLKLPQEWLLEVEGLPRPDDPADERLEAYGAVQLFLQRARRVRAPFTWGDAQKQAVVHLCRQLEGMPLGIELAVAWLRVLPFQEIARELNRSLDIVARTARDVPSKHRSLRAVFAQSWHFLSEAEKELWRKLAVFQGPFDRHAAVEVSGASPSELMALVDKSMLRLDSLGRFATHNLLRGYGLEKLSERPRELAKARAAHGGYYVRFLGQRQRALVGRMQRQTLAEIAAVIGDVRATWEWAVAGERLQEMMMAADPLARFYEVHGWFEEGRERFRQAADRLRGEPGKGRLRARLLTHEGLFRLRLSEFDGAAACLEESMRIAGQIEVRAEATTAAIRLAEVRFREGAYARAEELCREALGTSRAQAQRDDTVRALSTLGQVAFAQGRFAEAHDLLKESQELCAELGDLWSLSHLHNNLGMVTHELGRQGVAWEHFERSLEIFRDMEDRWGQALVTNNLGQAALLAQRYEEAATWLEESLALRREFGSRWAVAFVLNNLGRLNWRQGHYEQARAYAEESLSIRRDFDDRQGSAACLLNLGDIALAMGESGRAEQRYRQCLRTAMAIENEALMVSALLGMARLLARSEKDLGQALELLSLVAQHRASTSDMKEEASALAADLAAQLAPDRAGARPRRGGERTLRDVAAGVLARFN